MNTAPTSTFFEFARPYGIDPALGNSINFIIMPTSIKIIALLAALAVYIIFRRKLRGQPTTKKNTVTALVAALVAAALIVSARSDANMIAFYFLAHRNYPEREDDKRLAHINPDMGMFSFAKHTITRSSYAVVTPPDDPLMAKKNAQYMLAPATQEPTETAPYIIVTDPNAIYDKDTGTLYAGASTIEDIAPVFTEKRSTRGLYARTQAPTPDNAK